jgi:haloalkane dehalogenase
MTTTTALKELRAGDLTLAYRELGEGPPVLLLHGWPTSSALWRDVMPSLARTNRVLALDLPGFGGSDKPLGVRYDFDLFERAIDGFLAELGIGVTGLAAHDIGGPIGIHWTRANPGRVTKIALLNTLVYPEFSDMVAQFVQALSAEDTRERLTGPDGLEMVMRMGLAEEGSLSEEALGLVREPFQSDDARRALADAGIGLDPAGFAELAEWLPTLSVPLRIVYGERDRILPDVAETMARVKRDVPGAEVTALPECGHFLQEEEPERVGELLAEFF